MEVRERPSVVSTPGLTSARAPAVVLGDLDLVSSLGLAGIRSVVVTRRGEPVMFSRYTRSSRCVERLDETGVLVELLASIAEELPVNPVLYYQSDESLLLLSRNRSLLADRFHCLLPASSLVEDLADKSRFHLLAQRLGLPTPPTTILPLSSASPPALDLDFPVVLKPATRRGLGSLGYDGKAQAIQSPAEFRDCWPELARSGVQLLAQELIEGPEDRIESYHAYVDEKGQVAGEFTGAKVRTRPRNFGFSTAVKTTEAPDVIAAGRVLLERLQFRGVLKADYKRSADGRLHLLEVNPRFNLWHHLGAAAGVNLPAMVYADLVGSPRPPSRVARPELTWCQVGGDRHAAREAGLGLAAWTLWLLRTSARAEGRWTDPMPMLRGVLLPKLLPGPPGNGHQTRRTEVGW